ncbi:MAG: hypothetical protein JWP35_904 [Caulobacter sp.]|nr:hypothetical protein [Caulobacter sp.]
MTGIELNRRGALAGLGAAGLAACTNNPEGHGMAFTAKGVADLRAVVEGHVSSGFTPGVSALIDRKGETEVFAVGRTAVDGAQPIARDTLFRIASMTKLLTAVAVMMLVEEGKVRLDEAVDRLIPELANRRVLKRLDGPVTDTVPANRPITVEDLLTFRLGWGISFDPTLPIMKAITALNLVGFGMPDPQNPLTPDQWIAKLGTLPLMAQPGEQWLYTAGSDVQGVLVQRASGKPLDVFIRERITGPLGMKDTDFFVPPEKLARLCTAYMPENGKLTVFDDPAHSRYAHPPKFPAGDSGLVSSADDLLIFGRMLLADGRHGDLQLLSAASVKAMTTNYLTPAQRSGGELILGAGHGWGYGMSVVAGPTTDGLQSGAFGWAGGFGTSLYMDRAKALTIIMLTPRVFDGPDPPALHKQFWAGAYKAVAQ